MTCGPLYALRTDDFDPQDHVLFLRGIIRQLALIELQPFANQLFEYLDILHDDHLLDVVTT